MGKLQKYLGTQPGEPDYFFDCPACGCRHDISIHTKDAVTGGQWNFNGVLSLPTISPDILVIWGRLESDGNVKEIICHSEIKDGAITYLKDSTNGYAGRTLLLKNATI